MPQLSEHIRSDDWKKEKHVPVIECADKVQAGVVFPVTVTLGKEVAHPNTTEHHIAWVTLYYHDEGGKFAHQVANVQFTAHGESVEGANQGPVYTHHEVTANLKIAKSGILHAVAYCNIHGLWESSTKITVET